METRLLQTSAQSPEPFEWAVWKDANFNSDFEDAIISSSSSASEETISPSLKSPLTKSLTTNFKSTNFEPLPPTELTYTGKMYVELFDRHGHQFFYPSCVQTRERFLFHLDPNSAPGVDVASISIPWHAVPPDGTVINVGTGRPLRYTPFYTRNGVRLLADPFICPPTEFETETGRCVRLPMYEKQREPSPAPDDDDEVRAGGIYTAWTYHGVPTRVNEPMRNFVQNAMARAPPTVLALKERKRSRRKEAEALKLFEGHIYSRVLGTWVSQ